MPAVPAFCDTCGTPFASGFVVENSHGSFSGCRSGPCPNCGGIGHVPDGVFKFVGDTIQVLSAPERSIAELSRLAALIRETTERRATPEEVVAAIRKELPWFRRLADLLPTDRGELYGFLALVLAAAQLGISQDGTTINNITVNQVVERACPSRQQPPASPRPVAKKQGRNEQCACGSGKKYKKCCGSATTP
jgi:hypothetical protein